MSHDSEQLHEDWRKLACLVLAEKDDEKQQEWVKQLVISYQKEMLRQEELPPSANHWVN
jgi:hypothetical protein